MVVVMLLIGGARGWTAVSDIRSDSAAGQRHFVRSLGGLGGSPLAGARRPGTRTAGAPARRGADGGHPHTGVLLFGGLGLLVGSWTGAPRMIKALAQDYSSLGPRRSIAAMIPSFAIAQTAVALGIPVSFNEIIVSAIVGSAQPPAVAKSVGRRWGNGACLDRVAGAGVARSSLTDRIDAALALRDIGRID